MWTDRRGAVFIEKLIVYAPLMLLFFTGFQMAEISAAQLVVGRAASAAARAAAVVLPDDPVFYDGDEVNSFQGARRDDIHLAAAMILSAAPQLDAEFGVDVSEPTITDFGPIDVTVSATYHCGSVSLLCGVDGIVALTSSTQQAYHRAQYEYDIVGAFPPSEVQGHQQAMNNANSSTTGGSSGNSGGGGICGCSGGGSGGGAGGGGGGNSGQRVVEAGHVPVRVAFGEGKGFDITGLINCVGVVVRVRCGRSVSDLIGGHFVTPEMYDIPADRFTARGTEFVARLVALIHAALAAHPGTADSSVELVLHVTRPAVPGSTPQSLLEALQAAKAIEQAVADASIALRNGADTKQGSARVEIRFPYQPPRPAN